MCVFKFPSRHLITSLVLVLIFNQLLLQWWTSEKRGDKRNRNFKYLKNEKSVLDEIKTIFRNF